MTVSTTVKTLRAVRTHYCSGCGHGIVHKIVAEIIDEMQIRENTIFVAPIGCAVVAYDYFNLDVTEAAHGRAPAVATGIKRSLPDRLVISYQGDGDLLAIGMTELIHTANRGEKISIVFVNNRVYGMTGGQMAPTSDVGQKTLTSPYGRDELETGSPIDVISLLSGLDGVKFLARGTVSGVKEIRETKGYIKKSFETQLSGNGFSLVEILSPCPTYWGMTPKDSIGLIKNKIKNRTFEPGIYKDI